ncbi:MAG: PIN domain-containing protein [Oscillospiraceae bacterium]|nr:PIN domain-containing protein [Oscillospiraceae bacterium]
MKIFLIDFENVHSDGVAGVDLLSENDEVVIFYSNNADSISFEMMHKLMFCKAKLSYFKVRRGGRNALDFQMASYLGYLIKLHHSEVDSDNAANVEFFLISKDSGFDFVVDFWQSGNIDIKPKVKRFFAIKAAFGALKSPPRPIAPAPVTPRLTAAAPEVASIILETPEVSEVEVQAVETPQTPQVAVVESAPSSVEIIDAFAAIKAMSVTAEPAPEPPKPAPKARRTTRKPAPNPVIAAAIAVAESAESSDVSEIVDTLIEVSENAEPPKPKPKRRGRPTKAKTEVVETTATVAESEPPEPLTIDDETAAVIDELVAAAESSHELYISMVKRFGQKRGVELYRVSKSKFYAKQ